MTAVCTAFNYTSIVKMVFRMSSLQTIATQLYPKKGFYFGIDLTAIFLPAPTERKMVLELSYGSLGSFQKIFVVD